MMRQVSHKHIVYLYGVCVRDVESKCILLGRGSWPWPGGVGAVKTSATVTHFMLSVLLAFLAIKEFEALSASLV